MARSLLALTALLALASCFSSCQALTAQQVVSNIKQITVKSQALQGPAQSISIINGPLIVVGLGPFPELIRGFTEIIQIATSALAGMQADPTNFNVNDSTLIFNAFREFVFIHQQLLNILIGKAGLFRTVPIIGEPISAVLRQIEQIVDTLAFMLIDTCQSQASNIQNQANFLKGTVQTCIQKYDGLTVTGGRKLLSAEGDGAAANRKMLVV